MQPGSDRNQTDTIAFIANQAAQPADDTALHPTTSVGKQTMLGAQNFTGNLWVAGREAQNSPHEASLRILGACPPSDQLVGVSVRCPAV
jgi:hypothetical protein